MSQRPLNYRTQQVIMLAVAVVCLVAGWFIVYHFVGSKRTPKTDADTINNFEECASAGYPVQESYPEVCRVPGGKSFTRPLPPNRDGVDTGRE